MSVDEAMITASTSGSASAVGGVAGPGAVVLRQRLCGARVDVDHIFEPGVVAGGEIGGMDGADASGAELSEGEHCVLYVAPAAAGVLVRGVINP